MDRALRALRKYYIPALMVLPGIALIAFVFFKPIIQTVYLSFFNWNGILQVPKKFIGWNNYSKIFHDKIFWLSIRNVLIFLLQGIVIQGPVSFILALFISQKIKCIRYFKFTFFLPVIIPLTAIAIMWKFILNPNWGLINTLIRTAVPNFDVDFIGNPNIAIYSVVLVSAWVYVGLNMIIFSSNLISIPEDIFESAAIDGAAGIKKIFYITLPLMMESIKIYIILMITGALKTFDLVFVMTRGGPNNATEVPAVFMYLKTFSYSNFGYGATIATFILVIGLVGSLIANKYLLTRD